MMMSQSVSVPSTAAAAAPAAALQPPAQFAFPYEPYDIQLAFMQRLYAAIERGGLAIFESPTGTGKSLSLLTGALTWLRDDDRRQAAEVAAAAAAVPATAATAAASAAASTASNTGAPDSRSQSAAPTKDSALPSWFRQQAEISAARELQSAALERRQRIEARALRIKRIREERQHPVGRYRKWPLGARGGEGPSSSRGATPSPNKAVSALQRTLASSDAARVEDDESDGEHCVAEYHSDDELAGDRSKSTEDEEEPDEHKEEDDLHVKKILYCSRTHSQLSQFVHEIRNSPLGADARVSVLGSRANLCTNPDVNRLAALWRINDACMDLQKKIETVDPQSGKVMKAKACPYLDPRSMAGLSDEILAEPQDIEELAQTGARRSACAYYAARNSTPLAEIIVMPYNLLLHKNTRESVGLKLEGNVVIIDEAHNLMDTIAALHSVELPSTLLAAAHSQLGQYAERYKTRLLAKNKLYIHQLLHILERWIDLLQTTYKAGPKTDAKQAFSINEFVCDTKIDNFNFLKLLRYCEKSEISKKLLGFQEKHIATVGGPSEGNSRHISPLKKVEVFLQALTNASADGRVVLFPSSRGAPAAIKFMLLNPAVYFEEILLQSRSVILAGGTMSPVGDLIDQLTTPQTCVLPVTLFSCDHVVDSSCLLPMIVKRGPAGKAFNFAFKSRQNIEMLSDLGRLLLNVCRVVPEGVVVFFSSYDYEEQVHGLWQQNGTLAQLQALKQIFREPRGAGDTEQLLRAYAACIDEGRGALITCVVGGKLSEGINFKDGLGRCVVMVGLPFPNQDAPALKAKMAYLRETPSLADKVVCIQEGAQLSLENSRADRGQEYYENLCMKAVNQSIGRAIRHRNDYAAILLVDERYEQPHIRAKLPAWIRKCLSSPENFGKAQKALSNFFSGKSSASG